jgi:GH25 family lysozyme M1 (1,4-beta-N-acetylmuramidase)
MKAVIGACISQAQGAIDWNLLHQKLSFVYLVASDGASPDPSLDENFQGATQVGLPVGLIHLLKSTNMEEWKAQNLAYVEIAKKYNDRLPPMIDLQFDGGLSKNDMNIVGAKFTNWFEKGAGQQLGYRTNAAFFNGRLPLTDWARHRPLWVFQPGAAKPDVPKEWANRKPQWVFWSYAAGENSLGAQVGVSSTWVELIRFFGDLARFQKMFKVQTVEVDEIK